MDIQKIIKLHSLSKTLEIIETKCFVYLKKIYYAFDCIEKGIKEQNFKYFHKTKNLRNKTEILCYETEKIMNYIMNAYTILSKTFRRCFGIYIFIFKLTELVQKVDYVLKNCILLSKNKENFKYLVHLLPLISELKIKVNEICKVYSNRNMEELLLYLKAKSSFRSKYLRIKTFFLLELKKTNNFQKVKLYNQIILIIHELREFANNLFIFYENIIYIEKGKVYQTKHEKF